ncbi:MAG: Ni/Fe hydrogenase subunit alpha [Nitrospira sp.]|nr:Ni/Fe hydrogenase subunit alpha [bacterium]MBL7049071.1 Ni/Fe hydrogenase subunit alpha [Nitrospira sp.]
MKISCNINVHHLARVEGHGNIHIDIKDGEVTHAAWEVVETPRFFEAILSGKKWENAPWICGRICGICSIGHTLASIRAIENAFGIVPTEQTIKLRILLKHMETLQSHILHLYFLAAPDFLDVGSVFPLIKSHPGVVGMAARLKQLANDACDIVGGRRLHPTRTVVGGFTMLPKKTELLQLKKRLQASMDDLTETAGIFKSFTIPDFQRETEFVSLKGDGDYPFIGGDLISTDGVEMKEEDYLKMTNEYCVDQSTAKWARLSRESFAVGALARVNNNFKFLHPAAQELAESFGLKPVNHNPFMNNIAQLAECVHVTLDSIEIIKELIDSEWDDPRQPVKPKAGIGASAVEVPRGILYHSYEFDSEGRIIKSDCVIPTGQNHANIHLDLSDLARQYALEGRNDSEIRLLAEMLVRSYDPCISCSVH